MGGLVGQMDLPGPTLFQEASNPSRGLLNYLGPGHSQRIRKGQAAGAVPTGSSAFRAAGAVPGRVQQKPQAHRRHDRQKGGRRPKGRAFIIQHIFDPLAGVAAAEGQGPERRAPILLGQRQQRGGIFLFDPAADLPQHTLVTGHFHVSA